jgi:hypothetical protein
MGQKVFAVGRISWSFFRTNPQFIGLLLVYLLILGMAIR